MDLGEFTRESLKEPARLSNDYYETFLMHSTQTYVSLELIQVSNIASFIIFFLFIAQIVAVKQLNRDGKQGNGEFLVEVMMLSHLCHPHLVNLVGYCAEGDQRLLVYEYMSSGSLENHLLGTLYSLTIYYRLIYLLMGPFRLDYISNGSNRSNILKII